MAKSATKKKASKQPDLFDASPRPSKSAARKPAARGAAKAAARTLVAGAGHGSAAAVA